MERTMRVPGFRASALFVFHWVTVGFFAGTLTLLGPIRWITEWARSRGWEQRPEDLLVTGIILVYVALSAWVAVVLTRRTLRATGRGGRWGIPGSTALLAGLALLAWLNPQMLIPESRGEPETVSSFTFGPYPTAEVARQLEVDGYTAIISLLNPRIVPFEIKLLADEREMLAETGLELIHLPMTPWIGDNREALDQVRELAQRGGEKYYVHCYLGRDRVNVVRRVVETLAPVAASENAVAARRMMEHGAFERGPIVELEEDVFLTPYPTDEEYLGYLLASDMRSVLSLLDSSQASDVAWIEAETALLAEYGISFALHPVSPESYEAEAVLRAVAAARSLPRPMVVHAFLSPSIPAQAFAQAFVTGLPPLPPMLFAEPMTGGQVDVVAPNVAVGPRPGPAEFGALMRRFGIRGFRFLGALDAEAEQDRTISASIAVPWSSQEQVDPSFLESLRSGGPWYLYGPALASDRERIERELGPALPAVWTERFPGEGR